MVFKDQYGGLLLSFPSDADWLSALQNPDWPRPGGKKLDVSSPLVRNPQLRLILWR